MNRKALFVVVLVVVLIVVIAAYRSFVPGRSAGEPGPAAEEPRDSGTDGATPELPDGPPVVPEAPDLPDPEPTATATAEVPAPARLGDPGTISGRVLDRRGEPVADATVAEARVGLVQLPAPGGRPMAMTAKDGTFVLTGIKRETLDVTASKAGFATATVKDVRSGQTGVELVLPDLGSIEGVVLLAETGKPPPAAFRVQANAAVGEVPGFPGMQPVGSAMANPDGTFRIASLPPGHYRVSVFAEGRAPGRVADVEVKEGKISEGLEVLLEKGGTIAGVVVSDVDGRPIPGAKVSASLSDNPAFQMTGMGESRDVTTDEEGRFLLAGLPEGSTHVRITHDDYAAEVLSGVSVPGEKDLEVRLKGGGSVVVRLFGERGAPLSGGMAILQRQLPFTQIQKTAGPDGVARFDHVPAGVWMLMKIDPAAVAEGGLGGAGMQFTNVTVAEGETLEVEMKPDVGATVSGRVLRGGDGVPGAMVFLFGAGEATNAVEGMKFAACDESGAFKIENVKDGDYTLSVAKGIGVVPTHSEPITVAEGRDLERDVNLPPAGLSGKVTDEGGEGIPGVQVTLTPTSMSSFRAGQMDETMSAFAGMATSGEDGSFSFDGLRPGAYVARGWIEGRAAAYSETITVPPLGNGPDDVRIVLTTGVELEVVVLGPDLRPLAGAFVFAADGAGRLLPVSMMFAAQTDTNGRVKLRLAQGEYRLEVQHVGHPAVQRVARAPGSIRIEVPVPGTLSVVVTGADGAPVPDAKVELLDAGGAAVGRRATGDAALDALVRTRSGEDGRIEFPLLAPGAYRVRASTDDGRRAESGADVSPRRVTQVELTLRKE